MLLHGGGTVEWVEPRGGPALGLHGSDWAPQQVELPDGKGLVLLTDGLFEGHIGRGNERLGRGRSARAWRARWRHCPDASSSTP